MMYDNGMKYEDFFNENGDVKEEYIGREPYDFVWKKVFKYEGYLAYDPAYKEEYRYLTIFDGNINLGENTEAEGLENLRYISGYANFYSLEKAENLKSLERIGGDAVFTALKSTEGLENLKHIGGNGRYEHSRQH